MYIRILLLLVAMLATTPVSSRMEGLRPSYQYSHGANAEDAFTESQFEITTIFTTSLPTTTSFPSLSPSESPSVSSDPSSSPTQSPTTERPTGSPVMGTSSPSLSPSDVPSKSPTKDPTDEPSLSPSPIESPTYNPTVSPPTYNPTVSPTSSNPSIAPTLSPTTDSPSWSPIVGTRSPTLPLPTSVPSEIPSELPSISPTAIQLRGPIQTTRLTITLVGIDDIHNVSEWEEVTSNIFSEFYNDKRSPYFSNAKAVVSVTDIAAVTTDSSMRGHGLRSNLRRMLQSVPMMNVTYSQDLYYYIRYYPTMNLTDEELGAYPLSKLVNREKYVMHLKQVTGYADVSKVTEITVSNQLMVSEITVSESAEESSSESTPRKGLFLIEVSVVLICIFALGGFVYARRMKARQMQMKKDEDIARAREIIRMMHEDIGAESMPGTEHPSENNEEFEVESIYSGAGTLAETEGPSKPFDVDEVLQDVDQVLQDGRSQKSIKEAYRIESRSQTCPAVFRGYDAYVYELSDGTVSNISSDDADVSNTPSDDVSGLTYFGVEVEKSDYERSLRAVPSKHDNQDTSADLVTTNIEVIDVDELVEDLNAKKLAPSDDAKTHAAQFFCMMECRYPNAELVDTNDECEDIVSIRNTKKAKQDPDLEPPLPQSVNTPIQDEDEWLMPIPTSTKCLSPLTPTIVQMPDDDDEATVQHHGYQIPPLKPQSVESPMQIPLPSSSSSTNTATASLSASLDVSLDYQINSLDSPLSCATEEPPIDTNIYLTGVEVVASTF